MRDRFSVDADTLTEIHQMRRCVKSRLVAGALQDSSQRMTDGALAVGACYMNRAELAVRMTEMLVKSLRIVKPLFLSCSTTALEHGYAVV